MNLYYVSTYLLSIRMDGLVVFTVLMVFGKGKWGRIAMYILNGKVVFFGGQSSNNIGSPTLLRI